MAECAGPSKDGLGPSVSDCEDDDISENISDLENDDISEDISDWEDDVDQIKEMRFQFAIQWLYKIMQSENDVVSCPFSLHDGLLRIYLTVYDDSKELLKRIIFKSSYFKHWIKPKIENYTSYRHRFAQLIRENEDEDFSYSMDQCFCWTSFRVKRSRNKKRRRNRNSKVSRYFNNTKKFELFDIMHNAGRNEIERITHINKYMKVYTTSFMSEPLVFLNRRKSPELVLTNIFRYTQKFEKVSTASSLSVASSMPSLAAHIYQRKRIGFFSKKLAIHVSEFPCLRDEGDGTSLYVVLPATLVSDTWTIKQNITKDDIFNLVLRLLEPNGVVVLQELLHGVKALEGDDTGIETWPTFKVETNVEIPNLLEFLDKEELFVPGAIDLWKDRTRNAKNEHKLNLVHRVRVDITGNHTNLCAINSICTEEGIEQKPNIFEVNNDYPFVWFIYDKEFREIFFIGVFQNPKKSDPEMFEKIV